MGTWKKLAYFDDIAATKLDDFATPDDNTDLNASTAKHGLCRKGDGDTTHFLRGDLAWAVPPAAGATLTIAETEVFNGTAPTSWTDLDLSATIGAQATLVLLKVYNSNATYNRRYGFRRNGDTDEIFTATTGYDSAGSGTLGPQIFAVFIVVTSTSGVIEWICSSAQTGTTIDVIAYIK